MSKDPDLSLPRTTPQGNGFDLEAPLKWALYALCEISEERLELYRQVTLHGYENMEDLPDDFVKLPPRPHFPNKSLREVVDYHLEIARGGDFDPRYFAVCVYPDSATGLIVTLNDDTGKPDLMWVVVNEIGMILANLGIANTDWYEAKETDDEGGPQFTGFDAQKAVEAAEQRKKDEEIFPKRGYHVRLYVAGGIDIDQLGYDIEPLPTTERHIMRKRACKLQRLPANNDPSRCAATMHPAECAKHSTIQKNYFLVADEVDYMEKGVQVVHLQWDGVISDRTETQLREIGQSAPLKTQRAPVPWTKSSAAVFRLNAIVKGDEPWLAETHYFAVYRRDTAHSEDIITALDPRVNSRSRGEHRIFNPMPLQGSDIESDRFWPALIRAHLAFCKLRRFDPSMVRQYCIWSGDESPSAESTVELVKIDWDGNLDAEERLMENFREVITRREALASEAYQLLSDVVDNKRNWDGTTIDN